MEIGQKSKTELESLYCGKGLTLQEIADEFGCSVSTIHRWMDNQDIERRDRGGDTHTEKNHPWRDYGILYKEYVENGKTMLELADKWDCSPKTISDWCHKHDLDVTPSTRNRPPYLGFVEGYRAWYHHDGVKRQCVLVHRLTAVSKYGYDAVKDKEVHHRNKMKLDNRPSNIEVLGVGEHKSLHANRSRRDALGQFQSGENDDE